MVSRYVCHVSVIRCDTKLLNVSIRYAVTSKGIKYHIVSFDMVL